MNIHEGLDDNFKFISSSTGVCINHEERIKLEIALNNLHLEVKSDEMWFWGKIIGVEKDYYIAVAIFFRENFFPKKKFFFCSSVNFIFAELPEMNLHHLKDADLYNTYFIGNPDIILKEYEDAQTEEDFEDSNNFKPVLKLKTFTESDRLSYVIRSIDHDTSVVPEGAFKMLPINEVRRNDNFKGNSINTRSQFVRLI
jgi:radial spoke head protein 9